MNAMAIDQRIVSNDGSGASALGEAEAIRLAKPSGGKLRFFHLVDDGSFALALDADAGRPDDGRASLRQGGAVLLERAVSEAAASDVQGEGVVHDGFQQRWADAVAAEARKWAADLIVVGMQGRRGLGRVLLGSGAQEILRLALVPLLLVRTSTMTAMSRRLTWGATPSYMGEPNSRPIVKSTFPGRKHLRGEPGGVDCRRRWAAQEPPSVLLRIMI